MVCLTWANRRSGFFIFGEASEFIYRFFIMNVVLFAAQVMDVRAHLHF